MAEVDISKSYRVTPESVGLRSNRDPLLQSLDGSSTTRPVQEQYNRLFNDPTISGSATLGRGETLDTQSINLNKEIPLVNTKNLNLKSNVSGGAWSTTTKENDAPIFNEKGQQVGFSLGGKVILDAPSSAFFWGNISKDFTKTEMKEITPSGNIKGKDGKTYTVWDAGLELGRFGINLGEKSIVVKIGENGKFYLSPDDKGTVGFKFGKGFNKGGTPMMEKQMEMFEDGGLKDEGGMIDKESGNEVPPGSTRKEVRDDIPAQLSEGEFVFPADVVRFIGLEKLMKLRQQAKMGLKKMEEMGQMGNSDEATLPDDLPFDETDLLIVQDGRPMQMAKGGALTAADGTDVRKLPIQQSAREQAEDARYSFDDLFGTGPGGNQLSFRTYKNEDGVSITIRFVGNSQLDPIPEGYYPVDAEGNIIKPDDPEAGETPIKEDTVKPDMEYGGKMDEIGMVPGSVGSKQSLNKALNRELELLAGAKPTKFEELFNKLGIVKGIKFLDGKLTGEDSRTNALSRAVSNLSDMIDKDGNVSSENQEDFNTLAGNFVDASKGYQGPDVIPDEILDQSSGFNDITDSNSKAGGKGYDIGMSGPPSFGYTGSDDTPNTEFGGEGTDMGGSVSANVPDYDFDFGAGGADNPGNFGGVSVGADQGPGPFNKGGLGTKPKKKVTRKMKKGGLAASKK